MANRYAHLSFNIRGEPSLEKLQASCQDWKLYAKSLYGDLSKLVSEYKELLAKKETNFQMAKQNMENHQREQKAREKSESNLRSMERKLSDLQADNARYEQMMRRSIVKPPEKFADPTTIQQEAFVRIGTVNLGDTGPAEIKLILGDDFPYDYQGVWDFKTGVCKWKEISSNSTGDRTKTSMKDIKAESLSDLSPTILKSIRAKHPKRTIKLAQVQTRFGPIAGYSPFFSWSLPLRHFIKPKPKENRVIKLSVRPSLSLLSLYKCLPKTISFKVQPTLPKTTDFSFNLNANGGEFYLEAEGNAAKQLSIGKIFDIATILEEISKHLKAGGYFRKSEPIPLISITLDAP